MSGEGAGTYYAGTNVAGGDECRRGPTAYPSVVVRRDDAAVPDDVAFLACSGAEAEDVHTPPGVEASSPDQLEQLRALRSAADVDVELVVVSVGGNDAAFGDVARTCLAPGDCSELATRWLRALRDVGPAVSVTYAAIREAVGPTVPVLVLPYPVPLDGDGCTWSVLTPGEHEFLVDFTRRLNAVLRQAAEGAGFHVLHAMESAFAERDLRVCDGRPGDVGVNFVATNPVDGLMRERVNPRAWFHNSLHPNERGHAAMADVLATWIAAHPQPPAAPPTGGDPGVTTGEVRAAEEELDEVTQTTNEWALGQAVRFGWRASVPVLLVGVGAWLLWAQGSWWLRAVGMARLRRSPRS